MRSRWGVLFIVALLASCSLASFDGMSGGTGSGGGGTGGGGSGGTGPEPCTLAGETRACCDTGTQTCGGSSEFLTWGPCLDASGGMLSCCIPSEFTTCDGGTDPSGMGGDRDMGVPPGVGGTRNCGPGGTPSAPGTFGTQHECYGLSHAQALVYQLDRVNKKAVALCSTPSTIGPIEGFAIHPITGNSYVIAQDTSDFGKFIPKLGTQTCVYTQMGKFPSSRVGGLAFSPDGWLYAGDESTGELWRFHRDAQLEPIAQYDLIGTLPNKSEGLAISPKDGLGYNSDGSVLHIVDLTKPGVSLFSCTLGGGHETLFFDKDGLLYSTNNQTNEFVVITVDRTAGTCTVTNQFSVSPATELEASDCNTGCAYDDAPLK